MSGDNCADEFGASLCVMDGFCGGEMKDCFAMVIVSSGWLKSTSFMSSYGLVFFRVPKSRKRSWSFDNYTIKTTGFHPLSNLVGVWRKSKASTSYFLPRENSSAGMEMRTKSTLALNTFTIKKSMDTSIVYKIWPHVIAGLCSCWFCKHCNKGVFYSKCDYIPRQSLGGCLE